MAGVRLKKKVLQKTVIWPVSSFDLQQIFSVCLLFFSYILCCNIIHIQWFMFVTVLDDCNQKLLQLLNVAIIMCSINKHCQWTMRKEAHTRATEKNNTLEILCTSLPQSEERSENPHQNKGIIPESLGAWTDKLDEIFLLVLHFSCKPAWNTFWSLQIHI